MVVMVASRLILDLVLWWHFWLRVVCYSCENQWLNWFHIFWQKFCAFRFVSRALALISLRKHIGYGTLNNPILLYSRYRLVILLFMLGWRFTFTGYVEKSQSPVHALWMMPVSRLPYNDQWHHCDHCDSASASISLLALLCSIRYQCRENRHNQSYACWASLLEASSCTYDHERIHVQVLVFQIEQSVHL